MPNPFNLPEDDEAWTTLLRSLQPPTPAEPRPFFYARLQARLAAQPPQPTMLPPWLRRMAYAFSVGALVLALNADTALNYMR
ncbi:hypothetical protein [Hymenobacter crusticola]|uniref:Uncharacterized protein n=1 Tax=Hymenobacter crusticola TaxID=1770526 RepID=A0A243W6U2_9BACT|nr:hypothetical protein [Hymenobacter crusticola]OUJ70275.1 hypothetical protein BXP70_24575 [Hymenobacter crusticola]